MPVRESRVVKSVVPTAGCDTLKRHVAQNQDLYSLHQHGHIMPVRGREGYNVALTYSTEAS
jgi:hypothetical protein